MAVDLGQLQPELRLAVEQLLERARAQLRHPVVLVQGMRTMDEQAALYAQGRTAPGRVVTNARPGDSPHNFGAAVDVAFLDEAGHTSWDLRFPWDPLGALGEALGLVWGGRWVVPRDLDHFELPVWERFRVCS